MKSHPKPKKFDYNVVVIGAGAAGLVTSYIAAALKARVALIERNKMGGDCLNTGCVPSKALIRTAKLVKQIQESKKYGVHNATAEVQFGDVMARIHNVIGDIAPHDSVERYTKLGVECIQGEARIVSPYEVKVGNRTLTTKAIVIATGASPIVPSIPGLKSIPYLTSENLWELKEQPKRLLVLGGGPIGCELSQAFRRLGSEVTLVEMNHSILSREDSDVSEEITKTFAREGIQLATAHKAQEFRSEGGVHTLLADNEGQTRSIPFDRALIALGRRARTEGFGLEELGVEITASQTVAVDEFLATTNYKNIFVCGDVAGPYQFTHVAAHQAYYASVNALFSPLTRWLAPFVGKAVKVHYSVIPWCTYTDPEIATVGLTERAARGQGIAYDVTKYGLDDLDRAIADSEAHGIVKVLTKPKSDKILGATIVGAHASEMLAEFTLAMKVGAGLNTILGTIHPYPTHSEGNKYVAGQWKQARKPEGALRVLERIHSWRRGS